MKIKALACMLSVGLFLYPPINYAAMSQALNQDAAGLGDAQAGSAASALDASTEYYNPAGLLLMQEQELVVGSLLALPTYDIDANQSPSSGAAFSQSPFLHYAAPISPTWAFGFGVSSPFSMHSDWAPDSSAASNSTNTDFSTYDVSVDLAYALTQKFSIGFGIDFVRVLVSTGGFEASNYSTAYDGAQWTQAWHGGLLYQFTPELRAGLSYHSKINYEASGEAQSFDTNGAVLQSSNDFVMASTLPAYTTASLYYQFTPVWAIEGSVNYTQWSQADEVTYQYLPTDTDIISSTTQSYDFNNTWRTAVGLHYQMRQNVLLRFGVGYETSPYAETNTVYLAAPSGASYDASMGCHYQYSKTLAFDIGWTHLFYLAHEVNTDNSVTGETSAGEFSGSNDVIGIGLRWEML